MKLMLFSIGLMLVTFLFFALVRRKKLDEDANRAVQALADTIRLLIIGIVVLAAVAFLVTMLNA